MTHGDPTPEELRAAALQVWEALNKLAWLGVKFPEDLKDGISALTDCLFDDAEQRRRTGTFG